MENKQQYQINVSAPNLVNICIDETCNGEMSGRLYHCYTRDAVLFSNVVELLRHIENLFDSISYPQASTQARTLIASAGRTVSSRPEKVYDQKEIIVQRGKKGSFVLFVKFRQNSTWQGELVWMEKGEKKYFSNMLDFIKIIDNAVAV